MNKKQNKLHLLAGLAAALMGAAAVNGVCGEFAWLDPAEFNKDLNSVEVPAAAQPDAETGGDGEAVRELAAVRAHLAGLDLGQPNTTTEELARLAASRLIAFGGDHELN